MARDPQHARGRSRPGPLDPAAPHHAAPGKRTLAERIAAAGSGGGAGPAPRSVASAPRRDAGPDPRPTLATLFGSPVQRRGHGAAAEPDAAAEPGAAAIHTAAQRGLATPATALPHADAIQRSFGRHDLSGVRAHVGDEAAAAARQLGGAAYATGMHVVLGPGADLFTAAHEAAHVVQQRAGVQLRDGVGAAGDRYERHADAVATLVVQGRSAERLLDEHGPRDRGSPHPAATPPIQRFQIDDTGVDTEDPHHELALKVLTLDTDKLRRIARALQRDPRTAKQPNAQAALDRIKATIQERFVGVSGAVDPGIQLAGHEDLLVHTLSFLSDDQLRAIVHTGNRTWRDCVVESLTPRFLRAMDTGQFDEAARVRRLGQFPVATITALLTPYFGSAMEGADFDEAARILRVARFPVEAIVDRQGNTPLHLAILYAHQPLITLLLAAGHPTELCNHHGLSPRQMLDCEAQGVPRGEPPRVPDRDARGPAEEPRGGHPAHRATAHQRRPPTSRGARNRERQKDQEPERAPASRVGAGEGHASTPGGSRRGPAALDLAELSNALVTDYGHHEGWMVSVGGHAVPRPVGDLLTAVREYNFMVRTGAAIPRLVTRLQTVADYCYGCCGHDAAGPLHYMVDPQKTMDAKVLVYHWMTQRIPELLGELGLAARATLPHLGPPSTRHFPERHYSVDPASAPGPRASGWSNVPAELRSDPDLPKLARHKGREPDAKSTQEALSGLAAKQLGERFKTITPAPRRATESRDVEFYDALGMPWDQKGPSSHTGQDDVKPIVESIALQLKERFPERGRDQAKEDQPLVGVILDCTYLTERDYRRLWAMLVAQFDAEALARIVEVNVDFGSLGGKRDGDGPSPSSALQKLLDRATTTSHGAGACGPIFAIPETRLAKHVTNLDVVRSDPDGSGGYCLFKNYDAHLPQREDSYFVEYAISGPIAEGDSNSRVKLVHDKRGEGRLYITATHYTPFSVPGRDAALRNPFFEIVRD